MISLTCVLSWEKSYGPPTSTVRTLPAHRRRRPKAMKTMTTVGTPGQQAA